MYSGTRHLRPILLSPGTHLTVTWDPSHGKMSRGKPANTFFDTLLRDTGLASSAEFERAMGNRELWRCYQSCHQQPS